MKRTRVPMTRVFISIRYVIHIYKGRCSFMYSPCLIFIVDDEADSRGNKESRREKMGSSSSSIFPRLLHDPTRPRPTTLQDIFGIHSTHYYCSTVGQSGNLSPPTSSAIVRRSITITQVLIIHPSPPPTLLRREALVVYEWRRRRRRTLTTPTLI